jgi:hypothetical protein
VCDLSHYFDRNPEPGRQRCNGVIVYGPPGDNVSSVLAIEPKAWIVAFQVTHIGLIRRMELLSQ